MSHSQSTSTKACPLLSVVTSTNMDQLPPASEAPNAEASSPRRKLPLGAIVSPLSPFFNERAKNCALEQAKSKALETALSGLDVASESKNRPRSTSQSSKLSEASSTGSLSSSSSSHDSQHSAASPISMLDNETLPPSLPRISYEDWSKFGINLFTPKLLNPHSKMYYHYPSIEKKKNNLNHLTGNRPRSKSSTVHGYSPPQFEDHRINRPGIHQLSNPALQSRPHPQSPLTRFMSLRHPLERNYTR
ncbi:hypothetical protein PGT21_025547 [Puccinia graminis f. sp. tritici]|uniref:Uncharacterized protein n=1 Tax=Puccinia graminis f. sp. tritici TaxID=56615 RepID=A0A5B0NUW4_PUCGR|nr:hypothetical protein PGT21_025547 [Puccinia graminis f. sp. tritici]KAA1134995.1 hypothetical protein PGTUg99_004269 [Puccinia graminis f. sp. tritici]